ncbi:transglycosylase domain-containing protein [Anaeromicropila populeti]|uniref:Penicillin-binding protein 1A n=1 Tax=Anaeromicropila populeti TaxID=37658 RepID=A0A1I6JQU9_9FIRM|nr:PBP1A family penicillin-binding protein [Anaeromicropila populeti]SFR81333.1 penicillin-binding protein 1A [Anaeromicropila populeti]
MNFSKNGTAKKQQQISSPGRKLTTKAYIIFFKTILICFVLLICVGGFAGIGFLRGIIDNAPDMNSITVAPTGFSSTIYDSDGNETQKLVGSDANRIYVSIDKIPQDVIDAFVAIEDERYWEHNGIDIKGIFRAFFNGIASQHFDQGASTITQQLLKNNVFEGGLETNFSDKLERKIQEQYLAVKLESRYSKEEILEYYLNTINLGQNTLGVQAAANRYFNKDVSELTLSEASVIASITKNPSALNPITYPTNNAERHNLVLENMKNQNYITEEEYAEALADDVYSRIKLVNEEQSTSSQINSYFVDEVIEQVAEDLETKLGYTSTQAYNLIYRGGLKIYTTQNPELQSICDDVLSDESLYPADSKWELTYRLTTVSSDGEKHNYNEQMMEEFFHSQGKSFSLYFSDKEDAASYIEEYRNAVVTDTDTIEGEKTNFTIQPQISFVLMDQATGRVEAIVGGRGEKTASRTLNRATNTFRQPGSTFKILSTYLPALDTKGMTLATVQDDALYYYPGTKTKVNNWYGDNYKGLTTIRQAIYDSMNVFAVKTLEQVTPQTGFSYLQKLGFSTLVEKEVNETTGEVFSDINLSLALGGITHGVKNLEITAAFASIANGGIYTEPIFYTKIVDHDGKVLIDNKPSTSQVMKDSTAWLLTNAMEDVVKVGTGTKIQFQNINMPVSGKTGTSTDDNDLWFVGYTPYYTAGIWGGYDNNYDQTNTTYTKILWRTIMEKVHDNLERKEFVKPDSIVTAKICTKSGKLAVDGVCDSALGGSTVRTEYFAKGTQPVETCDVHVKVKVCAASNKSATDFCPETSILEKVYLSKEETSNTADTPYILPKNFENDICKIHSPFGVNIPTSTPTSNPSAPVIPNSGELPETTEP